MCNLCFCECRIAFVKNNNDKKRLAEIYDGLEIFGGEDLANNYGIKTSTCMSHESGTQGLTCDYNNEQDSVHMLYKRLQSISSSDEIDAIWYIGQAFLKCRENLCLTPFKFSMVQRRIENIMMISSKRIHTLDQVYQLLLATYLTKTIKLSKR